MLFREMPVISIPFLATFLWLALVRVDNGNTGQLVCHDLVDLYIAGGRGKTRKLGFFKSEQIVTCFCFAFSVSTSAVQPELFLRSAFKNWLHIAPSISEKAASNKERADKWTDCSEQQIGRPLSAHLGSGGCGSSPMRPYTGWFLSTTSLTGFGAHFCWVPPRILRSAVSNAGIRASLKGPSPLLVWRQPWWLIIGKVQIFSVRKDSIRQEEVTSLAVRLQHWKKDSLASRTEEATRFVTHDWIRSISFLCVLKTQKPYE